MESSLKKKRMRTIAVFAVIIVIIIAALLRLNIEPADYKVSLEKQIAKAEKLIGDAQEHTGNGKGQYAEYEVVAFQNQINAAQAVVDDENSVYETEKAQYETLKSEISDFKSSANDLVLTEKEQTNLKNSGETENRDVELSVYRSLNWTIKGEKITEAADLNLYAREDGPYYSRLLMYMEQFAMEGQTIAFYHTGEMPGEFEVTHTYYQSSDETKTGYVYKLNEIDNTLSYITKAAIGGETVSYQISEGGSYMILSQKISEYASKKELAATALQITEAQGDLDVASSEKIQKSKEKVKTIKETEAQTEGEVSDEAGVEETEEMPETGAAAQTDIAATDSSVAGSTDAATGGSTAGNTGTSAGSSTAEKNKGSKTDSSTDKNSNSSSNGNTSSAGSSGTTGSTGDSSAGTSDGSGTTTTPPSSGTTDDGTTTPTPTPTPTPSTPTDDGKISVTIEIRCDTLTNDLSKLADQSLAAYVPSNGTILAATEYKCEDGANVYDILNNVCRNNNIQMEATYDPVFGGYYVNGINHLYEFNAGTYSGWIFKINNVFQNTGASKCTVTDGDTIVWAYTCANGDVSGVWE